jgi:hypothetical protein
VNKEMTPRGQISPLGARSEVKNGPLVTLVMVAAPKKNCPAQRGLVVTSLPATEETGAMGRGIESLRGIRCELFKQINKTIQELVRLKINIKNIIN